MLIVDACSMRVTQSFLNFSSGGGGSSSTPSTSASSGAQTSTATAAAAAAPSRNGSVNSGGLITGLRWSAVNATDKQTRTLVKLAVADESAAINVWNTCSGDEHHQQVKLIRELSDSSLQNTRVFGSKQQQQHDSLLYIYEII